ncbi:hypothetical protein, partial [Rhodoplanes sp. SY1]|uniref:hypothetical protein n=1 Tax=Rhodoplanes sp. SY1 TaxID=3166646 RepID=UPI0038B64227
FGFAKEAAEAEQLRCVRLLEEIAQLEKRKAEAEAELSLARDAVRRLDNFEPVVGQQQRQCPNCWVRRGTRANLEPIPSDTDSDLFRCDTCHIDFLD